MSTIKNLSAKTIAALTAIANNLIANPEGYTQHHFHIKREDEVVRGCFAWRHSLLTASSRALNSRVASHADWLEAPWTDKKTFFSSPFISAVRRDMNLTDQQTLSLFGETSEWPEKFQEAYDNAVTDKGRARVGYNRIMAFIKTNGVVEAA